MLTAAPRERPHGPEASRLYRTASALWHVAIGAACSASLVDGEALSTIVDAPHAIINAPHALADALRSLYAGLALVLPGTLELRFRLLLAYLLLCHTENATEAHEHLCKALQILQTVRCTPPSGAAPSHPPPHV